MRWQVASQCLLIPQFIKFTEDQIHNVLTSKIDTFTVPLVVIFTKFDGQIIKEHTDLCDMENKDNWDKARKKAEETFQIVYLPKVMDTKYPPKAYLQLEGRNGEHLNIPCIEITFWQIWTYQR